MARNKTHDVRPMRLFCFCLSASPERDKSRTDLPFSIELWILFQLLTNYLNTSLRFRVSVFMFDFSQQKLLLLRIPFQQLVRKQMTNKTTMSAESRSILMLRCWGSTEWIKKQSAGFPWDIMYSRDDLWISIRYRVLPARIAYRLKRLIFWWITYSQEPHILRIIFYVFEIFHVFGIFRCLKLAAIVLLFGGTARKKNSISPLLFIRKLWESRYGLAPFGVLCRQRFEYDVCDRHKNLVKRTETKSHRGASGYYTWQ